MQARRLELVSTRKKTSNMQLSRAIGIVLALVAVYGLIKAIPLISGPRVAISTLSTDANGLTKLSGTASHTETLALDGGTLLIDGTGAFSKTLTLPRGSVILTLTATDRFGRSRTSQRTVVTP